MSFYFNAKQLDEVKRARIEANAARILSSESSEKLTDDKIAKVVENAVKMAVYLAQVVDGDIVIGEEPKAVAAVEADKAEEEDAADKKPAGSLRG